MKETAARAEAKPGDLGTPDTDWATSPSNREGTPAVGLKTCKSRVLRRSACGGCQVAQARVVLHGNLLESDWRGARGWMIQTLSSGALAFHIIQKLVYHFAPYLHAMVIVQAPHQGAMPTPTARRLDPCKRALGRRGTASRARDRGVRRTHKT